MMEKQCYGNQYFTGTRYSILNEAVCIEIEKDHLGTGEPSLMFQLGGDHLLFLCVQAFNRSVSLQVLPRA